MPVERREALADELVPAPAHLLLDRRLGGDETPHDELAPREEVRGAGDRVHSPLSERLEPFEREERRTPFLLRREEREALRADGVRGKRRETEVGPRPVGDLHPGRRPGGDLPRRDSDEPARLAQRADATSPGAPGPGAHAQTSQTRTRPSAPAFARRRPSGEKPRP